MNLPQQLPLLQNCGLTATSTPFFIVIELILQLLQAPISLTLQPNRLLTLKTNIPPSLQKVLFRKCIFHSRYYIFISDHILFEQPFLLVNSTAFVGANLTFLLLTAATISLVN